MLAVCVSGCYVGYPRGGTCCGSYGAPRQPPPPPLPPAPAPVAKKKIVLRGVNFDFDKSNIRPDAAPILKKAIEILQGALEEDSHISLVVEGHTDGVGSDAYNQALSMRRARGARKFLVDNGLDGSRISVEGFGEKRPVATNDTADGRAQNRRVELRVMGDGN